ncbi:MAG TPA: M28 family peptidase [Solirubrobacteraceae bacterium]|nr:M28 family peptidase [Solirubrobacteraceae bacterium]
MRLFLVAAVLAFAMTGGGTALANHGQPAFDPSKLDYSPIGFFKPGDTLPPNEPLAPTSGRKYNPSGKYNAFDTNFFETVTWPYRGAGDETDNDPPGGGDPGRRHGYCAPNPEPRPGPEAVWSPIAGECPNHQLEYIAYYEETMRDILGEFGVTFRRYEFHNPGSGNTIDGRAINPAAIVPGSDHPDEHIVVGAHYDKTTDGPASTWDSQEGHAQMIRVAKIMADYWKATGTRPSATVKFIPWDGEESGTLGSLDYATNNIVPGEEHKVRAYFNTDPCAGGYPAYRFGNPNDRVDLGIQIADEATVTEFETDRIVAFNERADDWVEQVFDRLDDTLTLDAGQREIFISTAEGGANADIGRDVNVGKSRPTLFTSDWRNFEVMGIPFFNPGPEVTGPDSDDNPNNPDALAILHTPNDNQNTMNAYTGRGPSQRAGTTFAEGWIKGMEMCAHLLAHGMLQPEMGGGQATDNDIVAYYEALPNEALQNQQVRFTADGTYQYANAATRELVPEDQLEFTWDFGDGTTGTGKTASHSYQDIGIYDTKLTVRNRVTGQTATMEVPVRVIASDFNPPVLRKPAEEDEDGTFPLEWDFESSREGFERFRVEEAPDYRVAMTDDAEGKIEDRWEVAQPTHPELAPWQKSDSSTQKVRGNQAREGRTSYWAGVATQNIRPVGVQRGQSTMTLKERIKVPAGSAVLSFWSIFQMEGDDRGVVEVATTDAPEAFDPVLTIAAPPTSIGSFDHRICDPSNPTQTLTTDFTPYNVELGQYSGKEVIVRFKLVSGGENRAASQPCGWYVDDLRIAGGAFRPIGESLEQKFEVRDKARGTWAYRVRGIYNDGIFTAASNVELVNVTRGVDPSGGGGGGGGGGQSRSCEPTAGFEAVAVRRLLNGRRLRFDFARRTLSPVRIDVFQSSIGRRVLRNKLVARFGPGERAVTWDGRDRAGKRLRDGYFFARFRVRQDDGRIDIRRVTLRRKRGRFFIVRPFYGRVNCGLLASAKLRSPVFGGRQRRALRVAFIVTRPAQVSVTVLRGKKRVHRFRTQLRPSEVTHRLTVRARRLRRRGTYRVRIVARREGQVQRATLFARRL